MRSAIVPCLLIAGTLAAAFAVAAVDDHRRAVIGYAQGIPEAVGPLETAKVAAVHVAVGEEVTVGQALATLDTSFVEAEIAVAEADEHRLDAEVKTERALMDRRLDVDLGTIERDAIREREDSLRLDAEAKALDGEIARVKNLLAERHALASDLAPLELRRASIATLAAEKPHTMRVLDRQMREANQRRDDRGEAATAATAKLEAELGLVRKKIDLLEHRKRALTLRATRHGRVASIDRHPGETANPSDAIVRVVSATDRVVACVPERLSLGLREGDAARLWVRGQRGEPLRGQTIALGPVVAQLPARCWLAPQLPMWGREVTVALAAPLDVVAGESFEVVFEPAPAVAAAPPAASMPAPAPRSLAVPAALTAQTRFEPSGIVALGNRYLAVSDDTGFPDRHEGAPWLFSFDASGAVADAPISMSGVSEIDDLESIATDGKRVWVLASQSFSKHGKRKNARTAFLELAADGAGYRVVVERHPAADIERALGLGSPARELDVEGMTFHDGALYLGVKAPLDANGDARILRYGLDDGSIAVWGRVHLEVESLAGGIAELLFMSDGSLAIAATPSTAEAEVGAIYRVEQPRGGVLAAKLVRRFAQQKPEGLAPALGGRGLAIVFDAGARAPSFMELPWPPP